MNIACIAWGSLVWDPRELPIRGEWFTDGPLLPVEFCRQSNNGRITLVLCKGKTRVRTLWVLLDTQDLNEAIAKLRSREGFCRHNKHFNMHLTFTVLATLNLSRFNLFRQLT